MTGVTGDAGIRILTWSAHLTIIAAVIGWVAAALIRRRSLGVPRPESDNVFYVMYGAFEPPFLIMLAVFALLAWLYVRATPRDPVPQNGRDPHVPRSAFLLIVAAMVCALTWVGSHVVLHDLPFSMDEYGAVFQSRIIAAGQFAVHIPDEWQRFAYAMKPVWVTYKPEQQVWLSSYLPGYATIRAFFVAAGAPSLTNPVLAGLAVLALAAVCRQLWPEHRWRMWLAVFFLVTSSQFLITSMSWYSMPAHLLLNLVWLYLYVRSDRPSMLITPWVGVLALGLHNPFPHALFVAPFLIRMLRQRRYRWIAYFAGVYGAGSVVWYLWLHTSSGVARSAGALSVFALPGFKALMQQGLHLTMILSWQSPVVAIFLIVALVSWRRLGDLGRDLAAGLILSCAFYFLFPLPQGHGWGYRYIYNVLGNVMILAVMGAVVVARSIERVRAVRLGAASLALSLLVQFPLRAVQVERLVRPFALANEYTASLKTQAVVIYSDSSWYGRDLVRNDPFLRAAPKLFYAEALSADDLRELRARFGEAGIHYVHPAELARLGVPVFEAPVPGGAGNGREAPPAR